MVTRQILTLLNKDQGIQLPTSRLPSDIKEFLTDHIETIGQLDALFIFYADPLKIWTAELLSKELRSNSTICSRQMQHLAQQGFLKNVTQNSYSYGPNEQLKDKVEKLYYTYSAMPVAVISYLYEKPTDKLKGFADAFKIKKD